MYRVLVFTGIILFVSDKFLLAGLIMAIVCIFSWVLVPLFKFVTYLGSSPRLSRTRFRAVAITVVFFSGLIIGLGVIPYPDRFRAPGVIEAVEYIRVINDSSGYVREILVVSGENVEKGTPLIKMSDRELDLGMEAALAQKEETLAMKRRAMRRDTADLEPIGKRLETINQKLSELEQQKASLIIRAKQAGTWVSPRSRDMLGAWISRGSVAGQIINQADFRFSAVVSQEEASNLFDRDIRKIEVRLNGQGRSNLIADNLVIIPYKHEKLPSAALGWLGGGDVAVSVTDESGLTTQEPFFQIFTDVPETGDVSLLHGQSGKIRFSLGYEPLLKQWTRMLRQLLQKRYQI